MVSSIDNLANAAVQKNDTFEKLVMSNKTVTDSIACIQAQNMKLEKLTAGTPAVSNPRKDDKTSWDPTRYCW